MPTTDLHYLTISEAAALLESGQIAPFELATAHPERIEETAEWQGPCARIVS